MRPTDALGLVTGDTPEACAETTAAEIARLLAERNGRSRQGHRCQAADHAGRHRHSLSDPRLASRVRGRARPARHRRICLQGSRFLRRRRNQGRARAALVPRRSGVGSPCRGASAIALRAALGRGDCGGSRRTSPRHCAARRRRLSISIRPTPRRWRRRASHARDGEGSSIGCRPPSCSISC